MSRFLFLASLLSCVNIAAAQSSQPAQSTTATNRDRSVDWSTLDEKDRAELVQLLDSPDWPIRTIALLRLERYSGAQIKTLIQAKLHDKAWQVRCFAIQQARRMDIPVSAADVADETDPHVIRAALRFGIDLPHDKLEPLAFKLLRTKGIDELMLGLEVAAACDIEPVRKEASRRAATLAKNMNDAVCALISRRLARVLGIDPPPQTAREWIAWSRTQGETIKLAPSNTQRDNSSILAKPIVADMEDETFTRLLDYLGALRQRDLDLVICMDATASMLPMVNQARAGVDSLILFLDDISREMRLAFVAYRDHDNPPSWEGLAFTTDIASVRKFLFDLRITGGADYPEAVLDGLTACVQLKWNSKATREVVLVGDAPPHEDDVYKVHALMESFRDSHIIVHAAHIPMEYPPGHVESMPPLKAIEAKQWLDDYNKKTGDTFADIAQAGGGRKTEMSKAEELVPAIMHFTIEEAWWSVFDEFYARYVKLCR